MNLSKDQIKEIAELLDCGLICYVNKETKEIKSIIDRDEFYDDLELWEEAFKEIDDNLDKYQKVEKMSSREAFQIMENFAVIVKDKKIKNRLIYALNKNNPFRNFKYEVDYNEDIRQEWFKFKAFKYQEWVKDYLESTSEDELDNNEESEMEIPTTMGFYDDDGNEYNPNLQPLPNLCLSCKKKNDPSEEIVCNLTRMDQLGEEKFICYAYEELKK